MGKRMIAVILVFVLSLAIWAVFYYMGLGLGSVDTLVFVGVVCLLVFGLQELIAALRSMAGK
jgi:ABC-type protease/lipase transport system fused ATPase/permease subunit